MMAKRKKSTIMPESKDNKIEETALPLVRTSDEPVTKKVYANLKISDNFFNSCLNQIGEMGEQTKSSCLCCTWNNTKR
jgi:hypothetical protein